MSANWHVDFTLGKTEHPMSIHRSSRGPASPVDSVTLERLTLADVDDLHRWAQDRDLHELTGAWPTPPPRERMVELVRDWLVSPAIRAFTIRVDGERVGNCWLGHIEDGHATLGISIGKPDHRDRGVGTEAMRLLLLEGADLETITLWVYDTNERAIAVYRRVGFTETGRGLHHERGTVEMSYRPPSR